MNTEMNVTVQAARKALFDKVQAQIHTFDAQVATLKAKAESAKADAEVKAIANLVTAKRAVELKAAELKASGENAFEQIKTDVERQLAQLDQSLQTIASRFNGR